MRDINIDEIRELDIPKYGPIFSCVYDLFRDYVGVFFKLYIEGKEYILQRRDNLFERKKRTVEIIKDITECGYYSISTIINEGDAIGCVIILSLDVPITDSEEKLSLILARLLSKQFVN